MCTSVFVCMCDIDNWIEIRVLRKFLSDAEQRLHWDDSFWAGICGQNGKRGKNIRETKSNTCQVIQRRLRQALRKARGKWREMRQVPCSSGQRLPTSVYSVQALCLRAGEQKWSSSPGRGTDTGRKHSRQKIQGINSAWREEPSEGVWILSYR